MHRIQYNDHRYSPERPPFKMGKPKFWVKGCSRNEKTPPFKIHKMASRGGIFSEYLWYLFLESGISFVGYFVKIQWVKTSECLSSIARSRLFILMICGYMNLVRGWVVEHSTKENNFGQFLSQTWLRSPMLTKYCTFESLLPNPSYVHPKGGGPTYEKFDILMEKRVQIRL